MENLFKKHPISPNKKGDASVMMTILVYFGRPQAQTQDPSMTWSNFYPLLSVHFIRKWIILVTQDKFKTLCSDMLWRPFRCILVHFGAPHVQPHDSMTPWPLHDWLWLLSLFKCPLNPEMDHISHSEQIRNTLHCHAMMATLVHFGAFWCTSCAAPWPPNDLLWLLSSFKCPFNLEINHISHWGQIRNTLLCHAMIAQLVHFGAFWCTSCVTPELLHDLLWLLSSF